MNKAITKFKRIVQPEKTKVKDRLSFVWLFGSGADAIKDIDNISNSLSPSNKNFKKENLFHNIRSNRAKFYQWLIFNNEYRDIEYYKTPEHYPEWFTIESGYRNLIDFELDLASISRAIVIFSESIGAYMEIGLFANYPEIQKRSLIISESRYIDGNEKSFYYLGAILKYEANKISDDVDNTWALETKDLCGHFQELKNHIDDIQTIPTKEKLDSKNRGHIIILIIETLDLFNSLSTKSIQDILEFFEINIKRKEVNDILKGLKTLEIVTSYKRSATDMFKLSSKYNHNSCIDFSGSKHKSFDRTSFKIEIRRK